MSASYIITNFQSREGKRRRRKDLKAICGSQAFLSPPLWNFCALTIRHTKALFSSSKEPWHEKEKATLIAINKSTITILCQLFIAAILMDFRRRDPAIWRWYVRWITRIFVNLDKNKSRNILPSWQPLLTFPYKPKITYTSSIFLINKNLMHIYISQSHKKPLVKRFITENWSLARCKLSSEHVRKKTLLKESVHIHRH